MKSISALPVFIALASLAMFDTLQAQRPGGPPSGGPLGVGRAHLESESKPLKLIPAVEKPPADNKVTIKVKDGFRVITANSIPEHLVGKFPNPGNPNTIAPQKVEIKLPLKPGANEHPTDARTAVGVFINGVYLEAGTGEFWTGGVGRAWNYEALGGAINLGLDENHAHVQPTGKYHYHGKPTGLLKDLAILDHKHSPLIGWAFDGFPIYALYGYSDPNDASSKIVKMTSSFQLKKGERPSVPDGPGGKHDGAFTADYEYVAGSGTLDECNGRFTKTPEFPKGTYAYFLSEEWPVIYRSYRGTPVVRPEGGTGPSGHRRPGMGGRPDRIPQR